MPTNLTYRLRIMDAPSLLDPDPTGVTLEITSLPGGTNPYIGSPPVGDGQELDPLTGSVRTGAYTIEVVDAKTGTDATGTVRVVTNKLEDAQFRLQLLSRRAYVAVSTNGGSSYSNLISGFVLAIRLVSPLRYVITVGDTRRVEQTQPIFRGATLGTYTTRGTITGGPITADYGLVKFRGGWKYQIYHTGGPEVVAQFREGYAPFANAPITKNSRDLYRDDVQQIVSSMGREFVLGVSLGSLGLDTVYSDIVTYIGTTPTNAVITSSATSKGVQIVESSPSINSLNPYSQTTTTSGYLAPYGDQVLYWPSGAAVSLPSSGSFIWMSMVQRTVSELCPLYVDAHPVDIVLAIWDENRVTYDPSGAWINTIRNLIGPDVRLALRLTETPIIAPFLEAAIFGPFGITSRTSAAGLQELVPTRIRTTTTPTLTIAAADLRSGDDVVFDYDEKTAVQSISLTQQIMTPAINAPSEGSTVPTDGMYVNAVTGTARYLDLTVFAGRDIAYNVPGMIHNAGSFVPSFEQTLDAVALLTFDRFGRGVVASDVQLLAGATSAAAQVGDEVYYEAPHYPNKGYRIGESTVGARIMQVIRRTETPMGPVLRLLDSGLAAQPATAPTISVAASAGNPYLVAAFTITNAATLNTAANLSVEVEWAVGSSTPTANGETIAVYGPADIPTGAVDLPPVTGSARTVYVRARTLQVGRRPSNWTSWASVTLTATPTPGTITASFIKITSAQLDWTNTSSTLNLALFAYQGGSAPANWAPYRVSTLPAGSVATVIRTLTGPSVQWTVALAYETATGLGPFQTLTLTTDSTNDTTKRPAGATVIPLLDDAQLPQGIALGLYASDQSLDMVIERDSVDIARVAGGTQVYIDPLPRDGVTYSYRVAHLLGGYDKTAYTSTVTGEARGIPPVVQRPAPVTPIIRVELEETDTTALVRLQISDPQGRLVQVRFRHRIDGGAWSGWTIDGTVPYEYQETLPASGFLDIEYEVTGFDADGIERILAGGVESFDAGTGADMVTVVGSFGLDGSLILVFVGDSDTKSIKFVASTASQPTKSTVQAASAINGRNIPQTLTGPYNIGQTVYVSVLAYNDVSGTGDESELFEYSFYRSAANIQCVAEIVASTATQHQVEVKAVGPDGNNISGGQVQLIAVSGSATLASGPSGWVASPQSYTFDRGAPLGGSGEALFRARRSSALTNETDDDTVTLPEQGRDTKALVSRARELSTSTATTMAVRVAVNVPSPYTATTATITYTSQGIGAISPASGQTVTTGVGNMTIPETASSFVDFSIPRPAVGSPAGRVVFSATATGFVEDSDPIDVAPQSVDFTPPAFAPVLTLTSTTGQVSWAAVASGVQVEGSTNNSTWTAAGGSTYPSTALTRSAFGGTTQFIYVRAYNAANVYTPTYTFAVPPQDPLIPTITKVTSFTNTFRYSTDPTAPNSFQFDYTISNLPTGWVIAPYAFLDGVDQGQLVVSSSSSTQAIIAAPVVLNASGGNTYEWALYFEILDGAAVVATSKTVYGQTYY